MKGDDDVDPLATREAFSSPETVADREANKRDDQASADKTVPIKEPSGSGRLEVRCPICHTPMEVAVDTALTDITCSACGSHFSLVDHSEDTRMAPPLSTLGRFELIERIGVGGFGSVWKARDKELDRTVAVKIPRASGMTPEEQGKFFREARAAAQLRHPSIVSVYEVGRDGDSIYIVSAFVRGATLGDWLTGQSLTSRETAELCAKIADALHHAHDQGIVHRDLKPANIMMDYDGQPHLMDFGLARRDVGEVTVTLDGHVLGTPAYMSPEQAEGKAHTADRRTDVYSLGVILFQLLTGELPFRGNARMLIKQVIQDEPPSPRKLNANVPKDLETIALKCLEKDPSRRYRSASEVADELRRFLAGKTIVARPIGRAQRAWRWCKREPVLASLSATLILSLLAGTGTATYFAIQSNKRADESAANAARAEESAKQADERAKEATAARNRELLARIDMLLPNDKYSDDDIKFLEAEANNAFETYMKQFALYRTGSKGGSADRDALARLNLCATHARIAWAKGDLDKCFQQYFGAALAGYALVEATIASYEAGRVGSQQLVDSRARFAEVVLCANKVKRELERKPGWNEHDATREYVFPPLDLLRSGHYFGGAAFVVHNVKEDGQVRLYSKLDDSQPDCISVVLEPGNLAKPTKNLIGKLVSFEVRVEKRDRPLEFRVAQLHVGEPFKLAYKVGSPESLADDYSHRFPLRGPGDLAMPVVLPVPSVIEDKIETKYKLGDFELVMPSSTAEYLMPTISTLRAQLGTERTVKFRVQSVGGSSHLYLNSKADYHDPDCFTAVVETAQVSELSRISTGGKPEKLVGRSVLVTGKLEERNGQIQIRITDVASQLKFIDTVDSKEHANSQNKATASGTSSESKGQK